MEELIRAMAQKVDNDEAEGYLASCCVRQFSGDYQVMTGARTAKKFQSPFALYASLLGKLFHTITQGHPDPGKLLNEILVSAIDEFKEAVKDDSKSTGEFTVTGKL